MRDALELLRGLLTTALFGFGLWAILSAGQVLEWAMELPV